MRRVARGNEAPLGSEMQLELTEAQCQALHGNGWILQDGRSIVGSAWHGYSGNTTAPDHRGVFPRGKNNGRVDGNQDPAGERALGNFQMDAYQGHEHGISGLIDSNPNGIQTAIGRTVSSRPVHNYVSISGVSTLAEHTLDQIADPLGNGNPRITTETRVKNIAKNFFIKINPNT